MARVRWPIETVRQVHAIVAYIRRSDIRAADDTASRLFALGNSLRIFPHRGRPTEDGLRQMTGVPPYVLSYVVIDDQVTIVDMRHGRRRPYRQRQ